MKWKNENSQNKSNQIYVLIGPPTSWVRDF